MTWSEEHDARLSRLEHSVQSFRMEGVEYPKFLAAEGDSDARLRALRGHFENFGIAGSNFESQGNILTGLAVIQVCP